MSKQASFDIVSKVDLQEVDNAVNQANREISQRYDFKGSISKIEWDGKQEIKLLADNEYRLEAVVDILKSKMIRRGIAVRSLEFGKGGTGFRRAFAPNGKSDSRHLEGKSQGDRSQHQSVEIEGAGANHG